MPTKTQLAWVEVHRRLDELDALERGILKARALADGTGTATAALDAAIARLDRVRDAVSQAEEELSIEDGFYLSGVPSLR